jgi:hypothetical protein
LENILECGNNFDKPESLKNDVIGDGNALLLSFKKEPFPSIIFIPKAQSFFFVLIKEMHFSKQSSGTIVSGFRNKMYSPFAIFKAWLFAFAKPVFVLFQIKFTYEKLF